MNADEAKQLNKEWAATQGLKEVAIDAKIESAAKLGRNLVQIDLAYIPSDWRNEVFKRISEQFKAKGFQVIRNSYGGDDRDPGGHDVADISW